MSLDISLYYLNDGHEIEVASKNITHNLTEMADEAGIYKALWRPEENGYSMAGEVADPLSRGIWLMKDDPAKFRKFDAPNGWGTYDQFLPWLEELLEYCLKYPNALIRADR